LAIYQASDDSGDEKYKVVQTDYIKVISLLPYTLNLCTREKGQGKVYRFQKLFQVKKIIYSDLVDIIEVNTSFLEAGYFLILDPRVVRIHGLDETYSKILTKEKLEQILAGTDECVALFSSANEKQQEVIVDLLVQKLIENPESIDLNVIDRISRLSKTDIAKKAEDFRQLANPKDESGG
jgi:hypothetical protein